MNGRRQEAAGRTDADIMRRAMWRLGFQVAGCVAVIVAVLCGVAVGIVLHSQHVTADTLLSQAASRADDVTDPPAGGWLVMHTSHGTTASPGMPAGLPDTAALRATARTGRASTVDFRTRDDREYRVHTQRRGSTTVQAILSLSAEHRERARLVVAMLVSGGVGLLLAVGAGLWFGRRAVRPLGAALALQRRFVADASHELRTPLTLLSTRAQLLRRHYRQGHARSAITPEIDGVVADTGHLTEILEDLLLAADTATELPTERVDLHGIAGEVIDAFRASAIERSITLRADHSGTVQVSGSASGLRRALTALVDNAVRHARHDVSVHVGRVGTRAVVDVADDGPGIAPDLLPRVFGRFASTSAGDEGDGVPRHYGLGLALVADIAARHGGTVTAENQADGGAILRLWLPALNESRPRFRRR